VRAAARARIARDDRQADNGWYIDEEEEEEEEDDDDDEDDKDKDEDADLLPFIVL
jgi:hypothetical protein